MNVIVIGAGYAGTLAALRLAGKSPETHVTLINAADSFVERIRLHQLAAGQPLRRHSIPALLRGTNVDFVQGRVTAIQPSERLVLVEQDGVSRSYAYDKLIYALGSFGDASAIPGGREHALALSGPDASLKLQAKLKANPQARVTIIGGGLTGIELSTEIAEAYPQAKVTLLTCEEIGPNLSSKGHTYALDALKRRGITVHEHVTAAEITADAVLTADGRRFATDLPIWTSGFGVSPLARDAGLAVNNRGQILIDPYLRSISHPEIFAAGDSAASGLRMACATAMPLGAHAADNVIALTNGQPLQPMRFSFVVRCISLGRHDALVQRVDAVDQPRDQIYTGRLGSWLKEAICRYTVWTLYIERRMPGVFHWTQAAEVNPTASPVSSATTTPQTIHAV